MGRGRAKAKQTKVARELKYSVPTRILTACNESSQVGRPTRIGTRSSLTSVPTGRVTPGRTTTTGGAEI